MHRPTISSRQNADAEAKAVRRLYEQTPFPDISSGRTLQDNVDELVIHCIVTPFYLRDERVISTHDKTILDAGCGTGSKCRLLVQANPGARVVGVDFAGSAVGIARRNAEHDALPNVEFHVLRIEDIPRLGQTFDYINCDEVLYMQPDPVASLRVLASALKPDGILRANLHSFWQREAYYRAQEICRILGIFDSKSNDEQVKRLSNLMTSLRKNVDLKLKIRWEDGQRGPESAQNMLNNELLDGDRGSTICEMFAYLESAGLHFISMVQWRSWELSDLWDDEDSLPEELLKSLDSLGPEDRLQLFELIHPQPHRLIDFWCTRQAPARDGDPPSSWPPEAWHRARIHVHPQLCRGPVRKAWEQSASRQSPLDLHSFLTFTAARPIYIDAQWLACLYPALECPQMFDSLVDRWLALYPADPMTLVPYSRERGEDIVRDLVTKMEIFIFLLVEKV